MRASLADRPSFRGLLARVRGAVVGALAHADLPFEALVDELRPSRDLARTPLFQAVFAFQNTPGGALRLGDVALEAAPLDLGTAKFDLTLTLADAAPDETGEAGWVGGLEYDADLFERETVARFGRHLLTLLEAAVDEPDAPLDRLPLLDADEQAHLHALASTAAIPLPIGAARLEERFAAQAALTPGAVAVVGADGAALSYGEVEARASALAARLRGLGAGPGRPVALALDRSPALCRTLAALRAGAAYLPLDPSHPPARLGYVLADAQPAMVLVERSTRGALDDLDPPLPSGCAVVGLDPASGGLYPAGLVGEPTGAPGPHPTPTTRVWRAAIPRRRPTSSTPRARPGRRRAC